MRHGEPIEASVGQPQPSTTPQPCHMFAKHGFHSGRPQTPGETAHNTQTPCLEEMQHDKSWKRHLKTRQTAKPISMVSDPREFTVPFKNAQSKLIEYAAPTPSKAACVLSMVSGKIAPLRGAPRMETMLRQLATRLAMGSRPKGMTAPQKQHVF